MPHTSTIPYVYRQEVLTRLLVDLFLSRKGKNHEETQTRPTGRPGMETPDTTHRSNGGNLCETIRPDSQEKGN